METSWLEREWLPLLYIVFFGGQYLLIWLIAGGRGPLIWGWEPDREGGHGTPATEPTGSGLRRCSGRLRLRNAGSYPLRWGDDLEAPLVVRPPAGGRLLGVQPDETADFDLGAFAGAQDEAGAEISFDIMCPREWACFRVVYEGPAGTSPRLEGRLVGARLANARSFVASMARLLLCIAWLREMASRLPNRLGWRYAVPRSEGGDTVLIRLTAMGMGALRGSYHLARPLTIRCRKAGRVTSARIVGRSSPAIPAEVLPGGEDEGLAQIRLGSLNQREWVLVEVGIENPAFFARPVVEGKLPGARLMRGSEESKSFEDLRRAVATMSATASRAAITGAVALLLLVASEQVAALVPWPALWAMRALAAVCAVAAVLPIFGFGCSAVTWQYAGAAPRSGRKRGLHESQGHITLVNVGRSVVCEGYELTAPLTIEPPRGGRLLAVGVAPETSPETEAAVTLVNEGAAEVRFQRLAPGERLTVAVTYEGSGGACPVVRGSLSGAEFLREPDRGTVPGLAQWLFLNLRLGLATDRRVLSWGKRIEEDPSPAAVLLRVANTGNRILRADCELAQPLHFDERLGGKLVSAWIAGTSSPQVQAELRNCDERGVDLAVGSLQPREWVLVGASFDPPVPTAIPGIQIGPVGARLWRVDQLASGAKVAVVLSVLFMAGIYATAILNDSYSQPPPIAHFPPDESNWTVLGVCCGLALLGLLTAMFRGKPRPGAGSSGA